MKGRRTKDPIKFRAVPEAVEETEIYEDWWDSYDGPGDGDGGVAGAEGVGEWDYHLGHRTRWLLSPDRLDETVEYVQEIRYREYNYLMRDVVKDVDIVMFCLMSDFPFWAELPVQ